MKKVIAFLVLEKIIQPNKLPSYHTHFIKSEIIEQLINELVVLAKTDYI